MVPKALLRESETPRTKYFACEGAAIENQANVPSACTNPAHNRTQPEKNFVDKCDLRS